MGRILNTLEEQLINQLAEGETLKTWVEWQNWLLKYNRLIDCQRLYRVLIIQLCLEDLVQ